jgi:hypothetical protein
MTKIYCWMKEPVDHPVCSNGKNYLTNKIHAYNYQQNFCYLNVTDSEKFTQIEQNDFHFGNSWL